MHGCVTRHEVLAVGHALGRALKAETSTLLHEGTVVLAVLVALWMFAEWLEARRAGRLSLAEPWR